jgi:hypothetical protein
VSRATLTVTPFPRLDLDAQLVVLACPHGTTRVAWANAPGGFQVDEAMAIRGALARHYGEEQCRCVRRLWRKHFGAPLGEMVLVEGQP